MVCSGKMSSERHKLPELPEVSVITVAVTGIRCVCTSSRAADCGLARLAATDREGADADGLAVTSFFLSFRGLSRESSTVASVGEETKQKRNQNEVVAC